MTEFGKILDQWDKYAGPIYNKDEELAVQSESPASRRRRLHRKPPDASIDLHGFTQEQAWAALETFFTESRNNGLEKLLVIHGKGNHSLTDDQAPILKKTVRNFIERCPYAGENGEGSGTMGGSGSTWVLLKNLNKDNNL